MSLSESKPVIIRLTKTGTTNKTSYHFDIQIQYWDGETEQLKLTSYLYTSVLNFIYTKLDKLNQGINLGLIVDEPELSNLLKVYTKQKDSTAKQYREVLLQLSSNQEQRDYIKSYHKLAINSVAVY